MGWVSTAAAVIAVVRKLAPLARELWPLLTAAAAVIANHFGGGPLSPADSAAAVAAGAAVSYHLRIARRLKALLRLQTPIR